MQRFQVVKTPAGEMVLRVRPHGVGPLGFMEPLGRYPFQLLARSLRRDRRWTIILCAYDEDPFGPPVYRREVESRALVPGAVSEMLGLARAGRLPRG